jgi:hypothetical protein
VRIADECQVIHAASAMHAFATDPFAAASSMQQAQVRQEVQTAVAVKQRAMVEVQGQAVIDLLQSAAELSPGQLDRYG